MVEWLQLVMNETLFDILCLLEVIQLMMMMNAKNNDDDDDKCSSIPSQGTRAGT